MRIEFTLNGNAIAIDADPRAPLLEVLRESLGLTGAKEGCGKGECGSCVVLLDGKAVNSCLVPAGQVRGREVETIEAEAAKAQPGPLPAAFVEKGAVQCGFCTPGMIMAAKALLSSNPDPTDDEIREGLSGNLCRCTGYGPIIEAVKQASKDIKSKVQGRKSKVEGH